MSFENQIQQWVNIDNQIKNLNEQLNELRNKRNNLEEHLTDYASSNNISKVQISDGRLNFTSTKVPESITFKYLERTLGEIISNPNQVKMIMDHIKQKRNHKIVQEIKRFSNN